MMRTLGNLFRLACFAVSRPVLVRMVLCKTGMVAGYLHFLYRPYSEEDPAEAVDDAGGEPIVVRRGLFEGLVYPGAITYLSVFEGKIHGTYESELAEPLERLFRERNYRQLVDVGSAEGYYAVGFARRFPELEVFAFDISPVARRLLGQLAKANEVADRVKICNYCTEKTFRVIPWSGRSLLICDCEGFERELLTARAIKSLVNCDLVIELHRQPDLCIQSLLTERLSASHTVAFVAAQTPIEKADAAREALPGNLTEWEFFTILNEQRQRSFGWLIARSRDNA